MSRTLNDAATAEAVAGFMAGFDAAAAQHGFTAEDLTNIATLIAAGYATRQHGPFGAVRHLREFAAEIERRIMESVN